jgi:hypothetical protein
VISDVVTAIAIGVAVEAAKPHAQRVMDKTAGWGKFALLATVAQVRRFVLESIRRGKWAS